jgi:prepilin signal peptidase PulO-like enzyme (type II secretory pathway)
VLDSVDPDTLLSLFTAFVCVMAAMMGASVASFLCVVAERVPRGETIGGRSHCVCGRQLSAGENVPVFGWLALGGRSRCCKSRIPAFYVLAEAVVGVSWGLAVFLSGFGAVSLGTAVVSSAAVVAVGVLRAKRA